MRAFQPTANFQIFEENYISWLYGKVGRGSEQYGCYWRVIRRLYACPFYVVNGKRSQVYKDINRIRDGLDLRIIFSEDLGYNVDELRNSNSDFEEFFGENERCSMLEMMVAFALRIQSDIMWDPDNEDRTPLWFWSMLSNAGIDLKAFRDEKFNGNCTIELTQMCARIVNRDFPKNGKGSFFPVFKCNKDMRKTELWYQMQFWIGENYPI